MASTSPLLHLSGMCPQCWKHSGTDNQSTRPIGIPQICSRCTAHFVNRQFSPSANHLFSPCISHSSCQGSQGFNGASQSRQNNPNKNKSWSQARRLFPSGVQEHTTKYQAVVLNSSTRPGTPVNSVVGFDTATRSSLVHCTRSEVEDIVSERLPCIRTVRLGKLRVEG